MTMFGYVKYDKPNLYIKDFTLYRSVYCGLCKGIKNSCGNICRFALTYDITFFSAILHNIKNIDVKITKQRCPEHFIVPIPMAETDELTDKLGALNTLLAYYKCLDNIQDENKGKIERFAFKGGYKRVLKEYPEMEKIVKENTSLQEKIESANVDSLDIAADASAKMVAELSDHLLEEYKSEYTYKLFYALGKWIYLIDALDDYDKDLKKKRYNPFVLAYKEKSKADAVKNHLEDLNFIFNCIFADIMINRKNIKFHFNTDLIDNVLFKGIPNETKRVVFNKKCDKGNFKI